MGLLARLRSKLSTRPALADEPPALITVYDGYGQAMQISRAEWEARVLPDQLAQAHDDADELYQVILLALNDGFNQPLLAASARLLEIDRDKQRSHAIRGIVLMRSADLDGAETVLSDYIDKFGPTGTILTNLAKVYDRRDQQSQADATLWQALELDPNQDNGLLWWATRERDKRGSDAGFWEAMQQAAALPGSWRPQLWLARQCLESKNIEQATQYYRQVLPGAADEPEVLMMISGDLGNNGFVSEMLDLVLPLYDPEQHDPAAGFNLLQACLATGNVTDGEQLLHRIFRLNRPNLKDPLFHYSAEFEKLRATLPAAPRAPFAIETVALDRPIWSDGLHGADWLFAREGERGDEVAFIPFANTTKRGREATVEREDDLGRLTRSLPLYLMESAFFWTDLKPKCCVPIVPNGGPVVVGAPWTQDQVSTFADGARFAVTGAISQTGDTIEIEVSVWDCVLGCVEKTLRCAASQAQLGPTLLQLETELLVDLTGNDLKDRGPRDKPNERFYRRPSAATLPHYLASLGQSLMLALVNRGLLSKETIWGERNMLDYLLTMALQQPPSQASKLMFLSAVVQCHDYGSSIYQEFKRQALHLIDEEKDPSAPVYKVAPLVLGLLDPEAFHLRKSELLKDARGEYREWLALLRVS